MTHDTVIMGASGKTSGQGGATTHQSFGGLFNSIEASTGTHLKDVKVSASECSVRMLTALLFHSQEDFGGHGTERSGELLSRMCLESSPAMTAALLLGLHKFTLSQDAAHGLLQLANRPLSARTAEALVELVYKNVDSIAICPLLSFLKRIRPAPPNLLPLLPALGSAAATAAPHPGPSRPLPMPVFRRLRHSLDWPALLESLIRGGDFAPDISLAMSTYGIGRLDAQRFCSYLERHLAANPTLDVMSSVFHVILRRKEEALLSPLAASLEAGALDPPALAGAYVVLASAGAPAGGSPPDPEFTRHINQQLLLHSPLDPEFTRYIDRRLLLHSNCRSGGIELTPEPPSPYAVPMYSDRPFIEELARLRSRRGLHGHALNRGGAAPAAYAQAVEPTQTTLREFLKRTIFFYATEESYDACASLDGACCVLAPPLLPLVAVRIDFGAPPLRAAPLDDDLANMYEKSCGGDAEALGRLSQLCAQTGATLSHLLLRASGYQVYRRLARHTSSPPAKPSSCRFPPNQLLVDAVKPFPRMNHICRLISGEQALAEAARQLVDGHTITHSHDSPPKYDLSALFHRLLTHAPTDIGDVAKMLGKCGLTVNRDTIMLSLFPVFSKLMFDEIKDGAAGDLALGVTGLRLAMQAWGLDADLWDVVFYPALDLITGLATMNPLCYPAFSTLLRDKFQLPAPGKPCRYAQCGAYTDGGSRTNGSRINSPISDKFAMCQCHATHYVKMALKLLGLLVGVAKDAVHKFTYSVVGALEQIMTCSRGGTELELLAAGVFAALEGQAPAGRGQGLAIGYWKQMLAGGAGEKATFPQIAESLLASSGNEYEMIALTQLLLRAIRSDPSVLQEGDTCSAIRRLLLRHLAGGVRPGRLSRNTLLLLGLLPGEVPPLPLRTDGPEGIDGEKGGAALPEATRLAHYLLTDVVAPHVASKVGALTAQRLLSLLGYAGGDGVMYPGCSLGAARRFERYFGALPQLKPFTASQYQCTRGMDMNEDGLRAAAESDIQYFIWWLLRMLPGAKDGTEGTDGGNLLAVFRCCDLGMCGIPKLASHLLPRMVRLAGESLLPEIAAVATALLRRLVAERKSVLHVRALLGIVTPCPAVAPGPDSVECTLLRASASIYCGDYACGVYLLERMLTYSPRSFSFTDPGASLSGPTGRRAALLLARAFRSLGDTPSTLALLALGSAVSADSAGFPDTVRAPDSTAELVKLVLKDRPTEALASYLAAGAPARPSFLLFRIGQRLPLEQAGLFFSSMPTPPALTDYSRGDALEACWRLRNWDLMDSTVGVDSTVGGPTAGMPGGGGWLDVLCDDAVERSFKANYAGILFQLRRGNEGQSVFAEALDDLFEPISSCIWGCMDSSSESDGFALGVLLDKLKRLASAYVVGGVARDVGLAERLFSRSLGEVVPFLRAALECTGRVSESVQLSLQHGCREGIGDLYNMVLRVEHQLPPGLVCAVACQYGCHLVDSAPQGESEGVRRGLSLLEKLAEAERGGPAFREYVYRCARLNALHPSVTIPLFREAIEGASSRSTLEYARYLDSLIDVKLSNAYAVKIVDAEGGQKLVGLTGVTAGMSFLQLLEETFKMYLRSISSCSADHCSLVFILNRLISLACVFCTPRSRDLYQNIWFDDKCCAFFYSTIVGVFRGLAPDGGAGCWYNVLPQLISRSRHALLGKSLFQPLIRGVQALFPRHSLWHILHRQEIGHAPPEQFQVYSVYRGLFDELAVLAMDATVYRDGRGGDIRRRYPGLWDLFQSPKFTRAGLVSPTSSQMTFSAVMRAVEAGEHDYIALLCGEIHILPSKQRPKKITWVTFRGFRHSWLVKHESKGDLRKDSRMMEIVARTNELSGAGTVPTFSVYLLSEKCGVIEWIENMQTFGSAVREDLKALALNERKISELQRKFVKSVAAGEFARSHSLFCGEILPLIPPVLHRVYMHWFGSDPLKWYRNRMSYTHSTAMWSILGFVVGLGDRHGDNLLLSKATGQVMHVDFDCLFGKGLKLAIPELVPFRLTQNVISGMGICGVMAESPFAQHALHVLGMLRRERKHLMSLLLCFVFDPLIEWERTGREAGVETGQCVTRQIEHKLKGAVNFTCLTSTSALDSHPTVAEPAVQGLEPSRQLELLVNTATCSHNLSRMFVGWAPWL